jgi:hypothetical protein
MQTVTLKANPDIRRIVNYAARNYRKTKAYVSVFSGNTNISSYWDGGSKSYYTVVNLATGMCHNLPTSTHPYFDIAVAGMASCRTPDVESDARGNLYLRRLPEGFALVETGMFMGKTATAHVFLSPADMPLQLLLTANIVV